MPFERKMSAPFSCREAGKARLSAITASPARTAGANNTTSQSLRAMPCRTRSRLPSQAWTFGKHSSPSASMPTEVTLEEWECSAPSCICTGPGASTAAVTTTTALAWRRHSSCQPLVWLAGPCRHSPPPPSHNAHSMQCLLGSHACPHNVVQWVTGSVATSSHPGSRAPRPALGPG